MFINPDVTPPATKAPAEPLAPIAAAGTAANNEGKATPTVPAPLAT